MDSNIFTPKGAKLVKCISDYKRAEKYIRFGRMTIGLYKVLQRG